MPAQQRAEDRRRGTMSRPTKARVVIVSPRGRVALIRRRRAGRTYWSFPGGGIHDGESARHAARREVSEELGLDVSPGSRLVTTRRHTIFLARVGGEPRLRMRGPEVLREGRAAYRPEWVPLALLPRLDVRPRGARRVLASLAGTRGGRRAA